MSDILCDYCRREWSEDVPFVEGHRGCMICGQCLAVAYDVLVNQRHTERTGDYTCRLCRETGEDRLALDRGDEPGWASPAHPDVVVCRRCVKRAAGVLHKDPDHDWRKPDST